MRTTHFEGDDCLPDGHVRDLAAVQAAAIAQTAALRSAGCEVEITPAGQPVDDNRIVWRCATHDAAGGGRDFDSADADARVHAYEILVETVTRAMRDAEARPACNYCHRTVAPLTDGRCGHCDNRCADLDGGCNLRKPPPRLGESL